MKHFLFTILLALPLSLWAQSKPQPPIGVEAMMGNNRANFQLTMNKAVAGKFRYNNITIATAPYEVKKGGTELIMVNSFIYQFHRNVGVSGGMQYHFLKGFVPNVALHTSYANPTWTLLLTPYLNFLPDTNSETIATVEFKPQLNENLRLYTRATALYNHNLTTNKHDRSFYYFRLGLTFGKFTLGAAANFDYYAPQKIYKDNFGGFFKMDI